MSLQSFTAAYVECALWSSTDDNGEPLDRTDATLSPEARARMQDDCADFYKQFSELWEDHYSDEHAGHDFWLTRNRHGAGFWDGDLPKEIGQKLTDMAHPYGGCDLYIGDDGQIYAA
jgi:hypothetical protein